MWTFITTYLYTCISDEDAFPRFCIIYYKDRDIYNKALSVVILLQNLLLIISEMTLKSAKSLTTHSGVNPRARRREANGHAPQ